MADETESMAVWPAATAGLAPLDSVESVRRRDLRLGLWLTDGTERRPGVWLLDRTCGREQRAARRGWLDDARRGGVQCVCTGPSPAVTGWGVQWLPVGPGWRSDGGSPGFTSRMVVHRLIEAAGSGGMLVLGARLSERGELADEVRRILRELGEWLDINGAALFGTEPLAPASADGVWYLADAVWAYACLVPTPGQGRPPERVRLRAHPPWTGEPVRLLGHAEPLSWRIVDGVVDVALPRGVAPCDFAWVLKYRRQP